MSSTPVLQTTGVRKHYGELTAVADADLDVAAGEILGIHGASGSGKSTLLRIHGASLPGPAGHLNPRWPLWRLITEPLLAAPLRARPTRAERHDRAATALAGVGLAHLDPDRVSSLVRVTSTITSRTRGLAAEQQPTGFGGFGASGYGALPILTGHVLIGGPAAVHHLSWRGGGATRRPLRGREWKPGRDVRRRRPAGHA